MARDWLAYVEDEPAADDALARSALDGARLSAALALGEARALPALGAWRGAAGGVLRRYVARCALEAGRPQEAATTARSAAALAEGPRKVSVLLVEARALRAAGEPARARAAAEEAIRHGEALPEAVRPEGALRAARKLRDQLRDRLPG